MSTTLHSTSRRHHFITTKAKTITETTNKRSQKNEEWAYHIGRYLDYNKWFVLTVTVIVVAAYSWHAKEQRLQSLEKSRQIFASFNHNLQIMTSPDFGDYLDLIRTEIQSTRVGGKSDLDEKAKERRNVAYALLERTRHDINRKKFARVHDHIAAAKVYMASGSYPPGYDFTLRE